MTQRLEYIDIMRGIAILLVIFVHCIGSLKDPTEGIILSFIMSLFFFISGSCFKMGRYSKLIIKKLYSIIVPQITLGVICIATTILFDVFMKKSMSLSEVNYIKPLGNWFLPVLFFMQMLMIPIIALVQNKKALLLITLIVFGVFCVTSYSAVSYVQQTLAALIFGLLGFVTRPWLDKYNSSTSKYKGFGWIVLLIVALLSTFNAPIGMYINQYGCKPLFVLVSLLGIYSFLDISVSLKNSTFLQWCGRMSIIIYVWQFSVSRVSRAIVSSLHLSTCFVYIASFILCMIMFVPITYVSNKYLYKLFGK